METPHSAKLYSMLKPSTRTDSYYIYAVRNWPISITALYKVLGVLEDWWFISLLSPEGFYSLTIGLVARWSLLGLPRSLQWRHNGRDSISNHQPHDCLLNRLFRHRSKKTSKLRVTGLCVGNSPGIDEFPAQMASTRKMFPFDYVIIGVTHLC